jgi:hypothetical protein
MAHTHPSCEPRHAPRSFSLSGAHSHWRIIVWAGSVWRCQCGPDILHCRTQVVEHTARLERVLAGHNRTAVLAAKLPRHAAARAHALPLARGSNKGVRGVQHDMNDLMVTTAWKFSPGILQLHQYVVIHGYFVVVLCKLNKKHVRNVVRWILCRCAAPLGSHTSLCMRLRVHAPQAPRNDPETFDSQVTSQVRVQFYD